MTRIALVRIVLQTKHNHFSSAHPYPRISNPLTRFEPISHPIVSVDRTSHPIISVDRTSHPIGSVYYTPFPLVSEDARFFQWRCQSAVQHRDQPQWFLNGQAFATRWSVDANRNGFGRFAVLRASVDPSVWHGTKRILQSYFHERCVVSGPQNTHEVICLNFRCAVLGHDENNKRMLEAHVQASVRFRHDACRDRRSWGQDDGCANQFCQWTLAGTCVHESLAESWKQPRKQWQCRFRPPKSKPCSSVSTTTSRRCTTSGRRQRNTSRVKCSCERCKISTLSAAPSSSAFCVCGFVERSSNVFCFEELFGSVEDCCCFVGISPNLFLLLGVVKVVVKFKVRVKRNVAWLALCWGSLQRSPRRHFVSFDELEGFSRSYDVRNLTAVLLRGILLSFVAGQSESRSQQFLENVTELKMFGTVFLWELCQAIWWTFDIGVCDRLITDSAQSRLVTMECFGAYSSCSPNVTRRFDAPSSGWHVAPVLTKCAANVWPIGPIVRSQTCVRMQFGDSPRNHHRTLYKVRPKRPLHACSAKTSVCSWSTQCVMNSVINTFWTHCLPVLRFPTVISDGRAGQIVWIWNPGCEFACRSSRFPRFVPSLVSPRDVGWQFSAFLHRCPRRIIRSVVQRTHVCIQHSAARGERPAECRVPKVSRVCPCRIQTWLAHCTIAGKDTREGSIVVWYTSQFLFKKRWRDQKPMPQRINSGTNWRRLQRGMSRK